jgi:multidrug efflux system membrane fusion protein
MDVTERTGNEPVRIAAQPPRNSATRIVVAAIALLAIIGIAWLVHARKSAATQKTGGPRGGAGMPVPILAGVVAQKDVPIYLDGLGTVQAFNTVAIHSRVDGQLQKIAFAEGQDVKAGEVLAQIDPAPYQAALDEMVAKRAQDDAQLANARVQLTRDADLLKQNIVAQQDYDTQQTLVNQLQAAVKADDAAIENAKVNLNYTTITSPIDGRTGLRQVDIGNIVKANDPNGIVIITQLHPIAVLFNLPEQNLREIQKQMANGPLTVLAVDRDNKTIIGRGQVSVIDNQLDTATGTVRIKATFPNEDLVLWPGQFVNIRLLLMVRKGAAVVPASVVQRGAEGPYAFEIKEDQTVQMQPVKVGPTEDGMTIIEAGLTPGERVVVDGQYKLQEGSKVRVTTPEGEGSAGAGARRGGTAGEGGQSKGVGRGNGHGKANQKENGARAQHQPGAQ